VHEFYNARRANARTARPNPAHLALSRLQDSNAAHVVIVTQNVDDLHERAGSTALHMHGRLDRARCDICGSGWAAPLVMHPEDTCPQCNLTATRPDIVWFGEVPMHMEQIATHLAEADLFVAIGTSGQVYPAAGFVAEAADHGAQTLELNLERSEISDAFDTVRLGAASQIVPQWVDSLLGGTI
jgi:NAD-dependent deacetylase